MLKKVRNLQPAIVVLALASGFVGIFAAGVGAGLYFYPKFSHAQEDHDDHDHDEPAVEDHEDDHIALTRQAFDNLGLQLGSVTQGDYWKSILVPAEIVEIPGRSNLSVSAPVTGVIEDVEILPGESIGANQNLFAIRITDEELTGAQTKLLAALTRQDVIRQEIGRLEPIIKSGAVAGKRTRELEYEFQQLDTEKQALTQQLRGRGLPEKMIDSLLNERQLATTLLVSAPRFVGNEASAADVGKETTGYSIESLLVHPGKTVQRGDSLCSLAYHSQLYVQGTAFESDLETLKRIARHDWPITAESHEWQGTADDSVADALRLVRVDNHVDDQTQTVRFYMTLSNEVERSIRDKNGKEFLQWRYRPGQRLHLRLPVEKWESQITLPVSAVAVDGPNAFVFAEHHDDHIREDDHIHEEDDDHDHDADDHHDIFVELEPLPVRLLHRDDKTVVLAGDDELTAGGRIALNNAHKLHLAMKMQAAGGGGHHHDHDH